jgi:RNA polymerase sigma-70 factor, ECF subfamily
MVENEGNIEISLQALKAGDRAEFARLVDAYSTQIYRLALKMLADEQDAEDVLQNTFMKALQSIENFEGRSSLSTWLYRIAVNEALMLLRRHKPTVSVAMDYEDDEDEIQHPTQFTDWCCLPEEDLLSAEAKKHLDLAIQSPAGKAAGGVPAARCRRPVDSRDERGLRFDRNGGQDAPTARPLESA